MNTTDSFAERPWETRRNDNLYEYRLHYRRYYCSQRLHNTFLFSFEGRRMFPRRLSFHSSHQRLDKPTKRLKTPTNSYAMPESGHRQPRYRVCAVTNPIWRQELYKGLFCDKTSEVWTISQVSAILRQNFEQNFGSNSRTVELFQKQMT